MSVPSITPSATTWTLLLKHDRLTTLLHVPPDLPFSKVKLLLLSALQRSTTALTPLLSSLSSADEILLAAPVDQSDLTQGWNSLEPSDMDDDLDLSMDETPKAKGKGKARAKQGGMKDCPKGAGLSDGASVAFRLPGEEEWAVDVPVFEDYLGVEEDGDADGVMGEEDEGLATEEDEVDIPVPRNALGS